MSATKAPDQQSSPWLWGVLALTLLLTLYMSVQPEKSDEAIEIATPVRKTNSMKSKPSSPQRVSQTNLVKVPKNLIQLELLEREHSLQSIGNAFMPRSWYVPPPPPSEDALMQEFKAPKAPPVPFKYVGRFNHYQLWLQEGDKLHTVEVGDTIKGVWRIEADEANRVVMTYIPLNQQTILNKQ